MYAIGVDSETQGTKVLILDFNGDVCGRGNAPHSFRDNLNPGESEKDPKIWIKAFEKALSDALKEANIPGFRNCVPGSFRTAAWLCSS